MILDLGSSCPSALLERLARRRDSIVERWLESAIGDYAENAFGFPGDGKDRFRNPVGHALRTGLPVLIDSLLQGKADAEMGPRLDEIMRIRAVQDFSPSRAVAFLFRLKEIAREELRRDAGIAFDEAGLAGFAARVDALALLAFDMFVRCREAICEIKARSAKRQSFVSARLAAKTMRSKPD